jgi:chromatin structure-remodeling complex subunit RSC1/2
MTIAPHIQTAVEELIESICSQTAPGRGRRKLIEMFLDLPDKEAWPDYYLVRLAFKGLLIC